MLSRSNRFDNIRMDMNQYSHLRDYNIHKERQGHL